MFVGEKSNSLFDDDRLRDASFVRNILENVLSERRKCRDRFIFKLPYRS